MNEFEECELFETVDSNKISKTRKSMNNANNKFRYGHFMRLNLSETKKHISLYPIYDKLFNKLINIINKYNSLTLLPPNNKTFDEIISLKQMVY